MIFFGADYDGTLYRERTVSSKDIQAIKRFRSAGNFFAVVTGRPWAAIAGDLQNRQLPYDALICNNGADAYDSEGHPVFRHLIPKETAAAIAGLLEQTKRFYGLSDGPRLFVRYLELASHIYDGLVCSEELLQSMIESGEITALFFNMADEAEMCSLREEIEQQCGGQITFHRSGPCAYDINAKGASKMTGIQELCRLHSFSEVTVIGDGRNDLPMIRAFGGFAMYDGHPEVCSAASRCFESVHDAINWVMNR